MDADTLATLSIAFYDYETARQVLREWMMRHWQALNDDIAARWNVYDECIQAILPDLQADERKRLSLEWERVAAALNGATEEQLAEMDAASAMLPAPECWPSLIYDIFNASDYHDPLLSDDDLLKLSDVAGSIDEWLDEQATRS